jgi:hypothetical protein
MRVVVAWEGYSTNRFATPTDKNGLTWQLASQFEKGNGNLRSSIGELTKFLTWYKTTHPRSVISLLQLSLDLNGEEMKHQSNPECNEEASEEVIVML